MPCATEGDNLGFLMKLVYFGERPLGLFDGAGGGGGECGVGIVLKLSGIHFYRVQLAIGLGSNIKVELLGLWGLLKFALRCHIAELMAVGDSKVLLDRFAGKSQLNALNLQPWMKKIIDLKHNFSRLKSFHVHRQFNSFTYSLSKQALGKQLDWLLFKEVIEDSMFISGSFFISKVF